MLDLVRTRRSGAALLMATGLCGAQPLPEQVLAVRAGAAPGGDGRSWATAYNDLRVALAAATNSGGSVTEVWVGQGTYALGPSSPCLGFMTTVSMFGGFVGSEASTGERPPSGMSELFTDEFCSLPLLTAQSTTGLVIDGFLMRAPRRDMALRVNGPATLRNMEAHGYFYGIQAGTVQIRGRVLATSRSLAAIVFSSAEIVDADLQAFPDYSGGGIGIGEAVIIRSRVWGGTDQGYGLQIQHIDAHDSFLRGGGDNGLNVGAGRIERCIVEGSGREGTGLVARGTSFADCRVSSSGSSRSMRFEPGTSMTRCRLVSPAPYGNGINSEQSSYINCQFSVDTIRNNAIGTRNDMFINCLFSDSDSNEDPVLWSAGGTALTNCIIWRNRQTTEARLLNGFAPGSINYSCVQGWTGALGGTGNTGLDPMLSGIHLTAGSPCIDTGSNAALPAGESRDLEGNCRVLDGDRNGTAVVDMGPTEFGACYANCDCSTDQPVLNAADFACFMERFAARDWWANCDGSVATWGLPGFNVGDFVCFMQKFAAGCP